VIRFEYVFLELLSILVFLGIGGFLLHAALAKSEPSAETTLQLIGGSVFVALGGILAYFGLRTIFRQLQNQASQE
jgi:hypothetical protein